MGNPFTRNSERGVYVSTNAGLNWTKSLYINDSTGISNLVLKPNSSSILYAAAWYRVPMTVPAVCKEKEWNISKCRQRT
ncbi:MAG: hypothetical protein IPH93_17285 [Saprospiraceae bacterium]|nr:hypothetical protein [Saprospiraceae bacterium]